MVASLAVLSISLMVMQKAISGVTLHYAANHAPYDTEMAVFLGELMKIVIAFFVLLYRNAANTRNGTARRDDDLEAKAPMLRKPESGVVLAPSFTSRTKILFAQSARAAKTGFTWTLIFPAAFYVVMNGLYLKASKVLEPPVFQTLWQMRLMTTALFSASILKKVITVKQYGAILLMLTGLGFAQYAASIIFQESADIKAYVSANAFSFRQDLALGTIYLALAGVLSSLATVLLEKIFVDREKDLWALNIQLGIFSIIPCFFTLAIKALTFPEHFRPLRNLDTFWPWTAIFIHTFAGLLTSFVLRYAGSIARNFAAGLAILLTFVAARLGHHTSPSSDDLIFIFGASLSVFSSYMYYRIAAKQG